MMVSTADEGSARAYARFQSIRVGDLVHEVGAYQTTLDGIVKERIRGVPVEDTLAEIHRDIVHPRNMVARGVPRTGNTTTVVVAFGGAESAQLRVLRKRRQLVDSNEVPKLGTTAEGSAAAATERSTSRSRKNSRDLKLK
ncbi:hypothetical protein MRX96_050202 [Rhipicephalus microplus]